MIPAWQRNIYQQGARWHNFWLRPSDPLPLCLLRIALGISLLYTHWVWGLDLSGFLGETGWNNAGIVRALQQDSASWSIWWWVPAGYELTFHRVCLGILFLFTVGAFTRVTAIFAWFITVSYAQRAMLSTFGLDQVNAMLAFYLMLAPCGAYLSVDQWWKAQRTDDHAVSNNSAANLSARLIQFHLAVMYVWAGLSKLQGTSWWTGEALWRVLANEEYQSLDLTWLAYFPLTLQWMNHLVILFELSFPVAILHPTTRKISLALGTMMHLGIGLFLGMLPFGLIMIASYLSFADAAALRALASRGLRKLHGRHESQPPTEQHLQTNGHATNGQITAPRAVEHRVETTGDPRVSAEQVPEHNAAVRIASVSLPNTSPARLLRRTYVADELIYVARSKRHRAQVRSYFGRHRITCATLRGAAELIEKTVNRKQATVVLREKDFSSPELQYWLDEISATNPEGVFRIFLVPASERPSPREEFAIAQNISFLRLSPATTLRRIRKLFCNQDWIQRSVDPSAQTRKIL